MKKNSKAPCKKRLLIAYSTSAIKPMIRPSPAQRDWMDKSPDRYAYRCLPLTIANSHGWEILCPFSFSACWNGGPRKTDIKIRGKKGFARVVSSHFGSAILTFHPNYLFRSPAGYNLIAMGPPNAPKDGISALTGIVETDWAPSPFTMNWIFTRPNTWINFAKGEPFCFFFPIPRDLLSPFKPEVRDLSSNRRLKVRHREWCDSRAQFLKDLRKSNSDARNMKWQKHYYQGKMVGRSKPWPEHQTRLQLREFVWGG